MSGGGIVSGALGGTRLALIWHRNIARPQPESDVLLVEIAVSTEEHHLLRKGAILPRRPTGHRKTHAFEGAHDSLIVLVIEGNNEPRDVQSLLLS